MKNFFNNRYRPFSSICLSSTLICLTNTTVASNIDEVIVTSDFRPSTLHSVAGSLSVVTEDLIEARAAQHFEELLHVMPNVNFSAGSSRAQYFQIRGIGERSQFSQPINPSVGFIIDDVDFSGIGSAATLFDVEQVEVLRGPQGTSYGANALAGMINVRTNAPENDAKTRIEGTAASYGSYSLGLMANAPLVKNKLLGRIAVQQYKSDGFIENQFLARDDTNDRDELTARLRLSWLLSEELTVDISFMHIDIDNGYDAFSLDNDRNTLSDQPGVDAQRTNAVSFDINYIFSDAAKIETVLSYADSDTEYSYDEDWAFMGITGCQPDFSFCEYSSFDQYLRSRKSYTLDSRLVSSDTGKVFAGTTDWVVGVYSSKEDEGLLRNYTFNSGPFSSDYKTENTALYGQLDTTLNDQLTLITGLRIEYWDADYKDSNSLKIETDELLFGGKIGLSYQVNDTQLSYITLSRGYKAGGVNTNGSLPNSQRDFETEYLWNLEGGLKSRWLNESVFTRLAIFYTERKDQQVKGSFVIPPSGPGTGPQFIDFIDNAASGENYGVEVEFDWQFTPSLQFFGSLGLLYTEIDEYVTPDGVSLSGRDQAHAPNYQFNVGAQYDFTERWYLRMDVDGKDEFFFSDRHNLESDSYELVNIRMGYQANNWSVAVWGRNITDEEYQTRGFGFANDPRDDYSSNGYTQLGEPEIYGVSFDYDL